MIADGEEKSRIIREKIRYTAQKVMLYLRNKDGSLIGNVAEKLSRWEELMSKEKRIGIS